MISQQVSSVIENECAECTLGSHRITAQEFSCRLGGDPVVFRARLSFTFYVGELTVQDAVAVLSEWVLSGTASVTVGGLRYGMDEHCPVSLESIDAPDCANAIKPSTSSPSPTTSSTITPHTSDDTLYIVIGTVLSGTVLLLLLSICLLLSCCRLHYKRSKRHRRSASNSPDHVDGVYENPRELDIIPTRSNSIVPPTYDLIEPTADASYNHLLHNECKDWTPQVSPRPPPRNYESGPFNFVGHYVELPLAQNPQPLSQGIYRSQSPTFDIISNPEVDMYPEVMRATHLPSNGRLADRRGAGLELELCHCQPEQDSQYDYEETDKFKPNVSPKRGRRVCQSLREVQEEEANLQGHYTVQEEGRVR